MLELVICLDYDLQLFGMKMLYKLQFSFIMLTLTVLNLVHKSPHPIPGSNRIFRNWTSNMQNSDIFAKIYRNQIEKKCMHEAFMKK